MPYNKRVVCLASRLIELSGGETTSILTDRPSSPCKDICALDTGASVCTGCGRSVAEIAEWGSATASRQHEIVRRSSARLGSLVSQTHLKT